MCRSPLSQTGPELPSLNALPRHGLPRLTLIPPNSAGLGGPPTGLNPQPSTVNEGAPVTEQGVHPGNTDFPGVPSATGNVLTNDTDVDTIRRLFVDDFGYQHVDALGLENDPLFKLATASA